MIATEFTLAKSFEHSSVFTYNDSVDYQKNAVVSKTIIKKSSGTVTLFAFDAGQGLSEHTASFDALIQVIDGIAEISIKDKMHRVAAGESIILPANVPHAVNAPQAFKMVLIMIKSKE